MLMGSYSADGPEFNLDGHSIVAVDGVSPYNSTAALRVNANGTMEEDESVNGAAPSFSQIDDVTGDWIRPVDDAANYFVRYSNVTGTFTTTPGSVNTAIALSSSRTWTLDRDTVGESTVTFDLEILDTDETTVLAGPTGYTLSVNNLE
jgi:hypothetical protein